jgi:hypothetical protein
MAQHFMLRPLRDAPRVEKDPRKKMKIHISALRVSGAS